MKPDIECVPNSSIVKQAGPYLCISPVNCITYCLGQTKEGNGTAVDSEIVQKKNFVVKALTLPDTKITKNDVQATIMINTEHTLLKELHDCKGVIRQYGLFEDEVEDEINIGACAGTGGVSYSSGKIQQRICLALECYMPDKCLPENMKKCIHMVNLQQYVIRKKRLAEWLALKIFCKIVEVVVRLHERNIVHRDLKLGNIILDEETKEITLTNFGLGKLLMCEDEQLRERSGSPAYVSPEVISDKPYLGKPSDMWALGVILYTMLYGQFPFYDTVPKELFRKIKSIHYRIPTNHVSPSTVQIIRDLLVLNPSKRPTASNTFKLVEETMEKERKNRIIKKPYWFRSK